MFFKIKKGGLKVKRGPILYVVNIIVYLCRQLILKTDEILYKNPSNAIAANNRVGTRNGRYNTGN